MNIKSISAPEIAQSIDGLSNVLIKSVEAGGAIGFLAPLSEEAANDFWKASILPEVSAGRRILFVAEKNSLIIGTVQLLSRLQPNQPHRCEIAKMMVHPDERRKGIGRGLMIAALDMAQSLHKNLITLDTRTGDVAESLYGSLGFQKTGVVPDFALNPDGKDFHSTTYMFKRI